MYLPFTGKFLIIKNDMLSQPGVVSDDFIHFSISLREIGISKVRLHDWKKGCITIAESGHKLRNKLFKLFSSTGTLYDLQHLIHFIRRHMSLVELTRSNDEQNA